MFATGGQRWPVELLKQYLSRRPQELRDKGPFYLAIIENPKTNVWYKKQRLGHANEKSLDDYDEGREKEQRQLSNIISMTPQSAASSSFPGLPMWSSPATSSTSEQVKTSGHAFTVNNFHNCQVTFNVIQGQCSSPKSASQNVIP